MAPIQNDVPAMIIDLHRTAQLRCTYTVAGGRLIDIKETTYPFRPQCWVKYEAAIDAKLPVKCMIAE